MQKRHLHKGISSKNEYKIKNGTKVLLVPFYLCSFQRVIQLPFLKTDLRL